jgi:hypothetical protein
MAKTDQIHPVEQGDISVAMVTAAFLRKRFVVLKPLSERSRYDLVIDRGKGFERIQCKTGRLYKGVVVFKTCSSLRHHKTPNNKGRHYRGEIELFAVYCPSNDSCYLVPVDEVPLTEAALHYKEPKNNQRTGIRFAKDYAL